MRRSNKWQMTNWVNNNLTIVSRLSRMCWAVVAMACACCCCCHQYSREKKYSPSTPTISATASASSSSLSSLPGALSFPDASPHPIIIIVLISHLGPSPPVLTSLTKQWHGVDVVKAGGGNPKMATFNPIL